MKLWYRRPAPIDAPNRTAPSTTNHGWLQALPVGNGRMGAMVFGGVEKERIQLNDNTLWDGKAQDTTNPEALAHLPEVRRLLFEGKNREATDIAGKYLMGKPAGVKSFQTLGDLWIESDPGGPVEDYRRELDLSTGIVTITWRSGQTHFKREVFAPINGTPAIVIHTSSDRPKTVNGIVRISRMEGVRSIQTSASGLTLLGQVGRPGAPGMEFAAYVYVDAGGVRPQSSADALMVRDADSMTLIVTSETGGSLRSMSRDAMQRAVQTSVSAWSHGFDAYRDAHAKTFSAIMNRVALDLRGIADKETRRQGDKETSADRPTDERLAAVKKGADDPGLVALYFQFGRYLLLSSSRPGGLPANLQGLWNEHIEAPWNSDFHTNINLQMNYWPAEVANLSECHVPLFDYMEKTLAPSGRRTARVHYGARGWVVHHLSDVWGATTPMDGVWGIWPMGAAWLARHPWEHYEYTGDRKFLEKQGYPLMRDAARFILDFLVEDPKGRLVTNPSHSPENSFRLPDGTVSQFTYGATMDLEIIHDLFTNCIAASKVLNVDADMRAEMEAALKKLAPLQISPKTGRLQEWIEDYDEPEPGHRHISHMFAVYPGDRITPRATPELAAAARKSLEYRLSHGGGHTGWSRAWIVNLWARFGEGDTAYDNLKALLAASTAANLFDLHPPFQIDGNFGGTAGIAEMLLQSHGGEIALLPALPKAWPSGSYRGLRARGGFDVSVDWSNGKAQAATIHATLDRPCVVRAPKGQTILQVMDGKRRVKAELAEGGSVAKWQAAPSKTYTILLQ
jgi:alpha-L-fucosidase 2